MTVITVAQKEGKYFLVADKIINPFGSPQLTSKPKIFFKKDFVFGVSGTILNQTAVDLFHQSALDALAVSDFVKSDTHVLLVPHEMMLTKPSVFTLFLSAENPHWHNATLTGEAVSIGCFAAMLPQKSYGEVPELDEVIHRITQLHSAYGFNNLPDVLPIGHH